MAFVPPPSAAADFDPLATPFRLSRQGEYAVERHTRASRVAFFVLPDFAATHQDDAVLRRVEEGVEELTRQRLEAECALEQKQQQKLVDLARRRPKGPEREALLDEALQVPMPHCASLAALTKHPAAAAA